MRYLPNILSGLRILLVPVFLLVFFCGGEQAMIWAALVFLLAAITDFLDGHIARKYNYITNLGKILDPVGDKLLTLAMVACLAIRRVIPVWIPWFYLIKEVLMAFGGLLLQSKISREMPASNLIGKTATFVLFCVGVSLMLFDIPPAAAEAMIIITVLLSLAALISYVAMFTGMVKSHKTKG